MPMPDAPHPPQRAPLRVATELPAGCTWMADPTGRVLAVRSELAPVAPVPLDALLGDGWAACLHPDERAGHLATWAAQLATARPF